MTPAMSETGKQGMINFHGRRHGRPLRDSRQNALDTILPRIKLTVSEAKIDPKGIFDGEMEAIYLEIGFGNGDSLADWHRAHPKTGFIGCEPFMNGVAALCKNIEQDNLSNIRIVPDMAQPLLNALPGSCLDKIYLLNPDPWPKKRHHKRRFINQQSLTQLASLLKPGGTLTMTSDDAGIAQWMFEQAMEHPAFAWLGRTEEDRYTAPPEWLETRYEKKGKAVGRRQQYLVFSRSPR